MRWSHRLSELTYAFLISNRSWTYWTLSLAVSAAPRFVHSSRGLQSPPFDPQNVRSGLSDAQRVAASSAPDAEKAEAQIEVEVYEALQAAMSK